MKRVTLLLLLSLAVGSAQAGEVCFRKEVYGRVLKVEPITSTLKVPVTKEECVDGHCVSDMDIETYTYADQVMVTYRIAGKTFHEAVDADDAPKGLTVALTMESCRQTHKRHAKRTATGAE